MDILNFRSDTQTLPTPEMLSAIQQAPLGDDVLGEDPTVKKLERMAAEKLGKEAALLVISGTMGNLLALMTHASPGDEVLLDPESHIHYYEGGGLASVAGLAPMPIASPGGRMPVEGLRGAIRGSNLHHPTPRLVCLENTHNRSGGRVTPLAWHRELCAVAREKGLAIHLDGARLFNAAIATGEPALAFARDVDSIMFCLSKGLSCPLGSLLVGDRAFIERANRARKRIGGGMRQAGVFAACGIVALETMIDRMADDHVHARRLAEGIDGLGGLRVDLASVETNMVYVDHSATRFETSELLTAFKEQGLLASGRPPKHVRFVAHRHHDPASVDEALRRVRLAMG